MEYKEFDNYEIGQVVTIRGRQWQIVDIVSKDRLKNMYVCKNNKGMTECFDCFDIGG